MALNDVDNSTEYGCFDDVITKDSLLHEIETEFTCTPKCYKENYGP